MPAPLVECPVGRILERVEEGQLLLWGLRDFRAQAMGDSPPVTFLIESAQLKDNPSSPLWFCPPGLPDVPT